MFTLQRMYAVHYMGGTYNLFAFSEQDALRKAKELYENTSDEDGAEDDEE